MGAQQSDTKIETQAPPPAESSNFEHERKTLSPEEYLEQEHDLLRLADNIGQITFNSVMGTDEKSKMDKKYPIGPDGKRLKPCCACPETKKARDTCVIERGEENCGELIEAHKACMRSLGFNI